MKRWRNGVYRPQASGPTAYDADKPAAALLRFIPWRRNHERKTPAERPTCELADAVYDDVL